MATATAHKASFTYQTGHMLMATILWLIGGLPPGEQRPFVMGLCSVLEKWLTKDGDKAGRRWPPMPYKAAPPTTQPAARRTRRK